MLVVEEEAMGRESCVNFKFECSIEERKAPCKHGRSTLTSCVAFFALIV